MAAALNTCATIEHFGVVRFLWAKGMAAKDIYKEMLPMYGEHCLSRQAVHNWVQKFSEGRTSIEDKHRVGRPTDSMFVFYVMLHFVQVHLLLDILTADTCIC